MAKPFHFSSKTLKATICLFLLAISLGYANSARILDEVSPQTPFPATAPEVSDPTETDNPDLVPVAAPDTTLPSGQIPATPSTNPVTNVAPIAGPSIPLTTGPASVIVPSGTVSPIANVPNTAAPVANPTITTQPGGANPDHPALSFFMHDILGGSHPSGRVVTGVVANTDANGLPFSKPNNQIFPLNGGVPLNTINGVINNNNYPFLVGLNGSPANTIISNSNGGNNVVNGGNNQPFVTAGQLPAGLTVQQLMFGSVTVVDNQITEGRELDSAVLGSAQGFYLASSLDGSSHTLALTALFHGGGDHEIVDSVSFFGVHRTASSISHLTIIGGTGKYENAKGYAAIETDLHHEDQHTTDGVETITHFTVYLTP
ncbi:hypothetical protein ACH5RR_016597 [Cinchona calisaya]|uniref:Dirigent protein n=1 Tax=Cinchona calisaya TaxID=153742 RepID=A0ABD2ZXK5_9GENT